MHDKKFKALKEEKEKIDNLYEQYAGVKKAL